MQYPKPARLYPAGVCKFTRPGWFNSFCSNTLRNGPNYSSPTMNISNGLQGAGKIDVPQFQTLMLPLLKVMGGGHEMSTIQIRDAVAGNLEMTAKTLNQHLPTGAQNAFNNQMGWAITFLYKACLLKRPRREIYIITEIGKQVLLEHPVEIDAEFLRSYDNFNKFCDSPSGEYESLVPAYITNKQLNKECEININPRKIHHLRVKITTQNVQVYYLNLID
jgi:restriction endonuclease Mrr